MKLNDAFPSTWLKAADLTGVRARVTISHWKMEDVGDGHKPIVYFRGRDKGLVLNKTNGNMIAEIAGNDDLDEWAGTTIVLYSAKVDFQGKRVDAIRVDYPPKSSTERSEPEAPPPPPARFDDGGDDIPF